MQRVILGIRPLSLQAELKRAHGTDVNVKNDLGMTSLHWAAMKGDIHAVNMLLSAGASVDECDNRGRTALYEACDRGSEECTESLLAFGADVN